jgi:hypothetical protein
MTPKRGSSGADAPLGSPWSRRAFVRTLGAAASSSWLLPHAAPLVAADARPEGGGPFRYRAVSWWLTLDDLAWPNPELRDAIRRRADQCAASRVNCCLLFGAHFRWDFLPLWPRLHDLIRTVADELHARDIRLFDHHSSVLTHRPPDAAAALAIWERNRHHVPFYPSSEAAATWEYNGSRLNDWRMLDVETGRPVYLPAYEAEQFCMNHPAFRAAYARYVRELLTATGVDGLMSDDGIFYAGWRACACPHCRARFQREYGHTLPPTTDTGFWGNRRSEAFRDWIALRFRTSGDWLTAVRQALPPGFPLLTCCSSSDGHTLPALGMSYQDFLPSCDHVLLEMVGSTPSVAGTWDHRIPSQLLHLGLAQEHRVPCFGLGYGFFPDTAFFIWALNKFLGSDCWFCTLKGRLNASSAQLAALADDAALVAEGYRWEHAHPQLFAGAVDADLAVYFSRATRDYHGQIAADYTADFQATCLQLTRQRVTYHVTTVIPQPGPIRRLVLSSVACLGAAERSALKDFLAGGGAVLATGPCGTCDERANPAPAPWLREFGLVAEWLEPARPGGFPPYQHLPDPPAVAECRVSAGSTPRSASGWFEFTVGPGRLWWRPERIGRQGVAAEIVARATATEDASLDLRGLPATWHTRRFRAGNRWLVHGLPAKVGTVLHPSLQNQMGRQPVIERLQFAPLTAEWVVTSAAALTRVTLHSPDLPAARAATRDAADRWRVNAAGIRRYFILEAAV